MRAAWRDRLDEPTLLTVINFGFLFAHSSNLSPWIKASTKKFIRLRRILCYHFKNNDIVKFFLILLSFDYLVSKISLKSSAASCSFSTNWKHIFTMTKLSLFVAFIFLKYTSRFAADLARISGHEQFRVNWSKLPQIKHLIDSAPFLLLLWLLFVRDIDGAGPRSLYQPICLHRLLLYNLVLPTNLLFVSS